MSINYTGLADHINIHKLAEIVSWLYNEAPSLCWGSPEKVNAWLEGCDGFKEEE